MHRVIRTYGKYRTSARAPRAEEELLAASSVGDLAAVHRISQSINSVDAPNDLGWSPLRVACVNGHLPVVVYLVESRNASIGDALHAACANGHLHVAAYLSESAGADVDASDADGRSPLHRASDRRIAKYLVEEKGANVEATDRRGCTPLDIAMDEGRSDVVDFLLSRISQETVEITNYQAGDSSSEFLDKLYENIDEGEHVATKLEALVPLIANVHEMKLFYTYVSLCLKMGLIEDGHAKHYIRKGLDVTCAKTRGVEPVKLFRLILDYAEENKVIDRAKRYELETRADITLIENLDFIKDIRFVMARLAKQVDGLEGRVSTLEHRHDETEQNVKKIAEAFKQSQEAMRRNRRIQVAASVLGAILNAVSCGIAGSCVQGAVSSVCDYVVDFSCLEHLGDVMSKQGAGGSDELTEWISRDETFAAAGGVVDIATDVMVDRLKKQMVQYNTYDREPSLGTVFIVAKFASRLSRSSRDRRKQPIYTNPPVMQEAICAKERDSTATLQSDAESIPKKKMSISDKLQRLEEAMGIDDPKPDNFIGRISVLEENAFGNVRGGSASSRILALEEEFF